MVHLVLVEQDVLCVPRGSVFSSDLCHVFCASGLCVLVRFCFFCIQLSWLSEALAARYGVTLHSFADDNQCRIDDVRLSVADLERCITTIGHWTQPTD